jgi:hypothetical protein
MDAQRVLFAIHPYEHEHKKDVMCTIYPVFFHPPLALWDRITPLAFRLHALMAAWCRPCATWWHDGTVRDDGSECG